MRVVGYLRKSTDEADKQVYSLDAQKQAIGDIISLKGWEDCGSYVDEGISGTIFNRPGLNRLRADAKKAKFDLVLMVNFDRIARDNGDSSFVRKELSAVGVKVAEAAAPDLDSSSSTGKLIYGVKGVMAEFEHDMISERTKRAMRYAKQGGKHLGRPPAGFKISLDGKLEFNELGRKTSELIRDIPDLTAARLNKELEIGNYFSAYHLLHSVRDYCEALDA